MERGVYFDGWYRHEHCYHPSLPTRRLHMVRDLVRYHATMLVWSALGGGSVSLPFLEDEAWGKIPLRDRIYGTVNDSEFIAECDRQGIKVFGVVFSAQGWEFPVELDPTESDVLALNETRGVGQAGWLGLREFSQDRYPGIWSSFASYFPDGLRNSRGQVVSDLVEECASRALDGSLHRARWVECPDLGHRCYYMDGNNPVWREYLKAVIRIQVDAGVHGVQLDEAGTPLMTLQYGGCFCYDCTTGFRDHLAQLAPSLLPTELRGVDLTAFDYGDYLRAQGVDPLREGAATPLMAEYFRFQRRSITRTIVELADFARDYARAQGRSILVTGNLYNLFPYYEGVVDHLDVVVTEMRNVGYVQPEWFRYALGMVRDKQVVVVENPYGGVIPRLLVRLDAGEAHDLARALAYEAAAMGANMSLPYGSWMGAEIEDAFSLPDGLAVEIQSFLRHVDHLLSTRSANTVAVLYDVASNLHLTLEREVFADNRVNDTRDGPVSPFWSVASTLGRHGVPFDVVPLTDGVVPAGRPTAAELTRYAALVLPGNPDLPAWALQLLVDYTAGGGTLIREPVSATGGVDEANLEQARALSAVHARSTTPVGVNTHDLGEAGVAVHVVNYDLDEEAGEVRAAHGVDVTVPARAGSVLRLTRPDGPPLDLTARQAGAQVWVTLPEIRGYAIVHIPRESAQASRVTP